MRIRFLLAAALLFGSAWIGYTIYNYFFDLTDPVVTVVGIADGGYYAGDVPCLLRAHDGYKVSCITILIDGKSLINRHRINRKSCEYDFNLATKTMPNGKHTMTIIVEDGSYHRNSTTQQFSMTIDNSPLQAAFVKSPQDLKVFQGRTLHVQFQVNKEIKSAQIKTLSQVYQCYPESANSLVYDCYIPIKTDETPNEYIFSLEIFDHVGNTVTLDNKFQIVMYPFKKQNLKIHSDKIKHENESGLSIKQFEDDIEAATKNSPQYKLWQGSFYAPCDMKGISTEFGAMRITPERGKYSHNAVDLIGTPKSVVWATQDGVVAIKARYAHSGNTVVIDHGCGILSLFFHLDSFAPLNVGDKIKKGNPIGTLGMTGYASGYHLHLEMRINNIQVDPMQWMKHDF